MKTPVITGKILFQLRFCELEQLEQMDHFQEKTLINENKIEFQNWNKPSIRQCALMNEAHAASLLYVHPHPTAARRAATLASSGREMHMGARTSPDRFRGVLRHEKSPRGTRVPLGLITSQNAKYSVLFLRLAFSYKSEMTERIQNRLALFRWALRSLLG